MLLDRRLAVQRRHVQSTCRVDSVDCPACCDPQDEPGNNGNPPCFEGASCCADGVGPCCGSENAMTISASAARSAAACSRQAGIELP